MRLKDPLLCSVPLIFACIIAFIPNSQGQRWGTSTRNRSYRPQNNFISNLVQSFQRAGAGNRGYGSRQIQSPRALRAQNTRYRQDRQPTYRAPQHQPQSHEQRGYNRGEDNTYRPPQQSQRTVYSPRAQPRSQGWTQQSQTYRRPTTARPPTYVFERPQAPVENSAPTFKKHPTANERAPQRSTISSNYPQSRGRSINEVFNNRTSYYPSRGPTTRLISHSSVNNPPKKTTYKYPKSSARPRSLPKPTPVKPVIPQDTCPKRDWKPCVQQQVADTRFLSCCKQRGLPSGCHSICNFRQNRNDLEQAFWWRRTCPVTVIPLYMYCASNGEDARPCCKAHDVTTGNRNICAPFCYPGGGIPAFQVKYIKCLTQLESIVNCYRAHHQPISQPAQYKPSSKYQKQG